jgi:hypothetical protein
LSLKIFEAKIAAGELLIAEERKVASSQLLVASGDGGNSLETSNQQLLP